MLLLLLVVDVLRRFKLCVSFQVVKPVCTPGGDKYHKRVKLYLDKDKKPVWETVLAPNGYINMLQCLTEKPANTGVH